MYVCIYTLAHTHTHTYIYKVKVKLAIVVEGDQKAPFSIATTPKCKGDHYSVSKIVPLYTDLILSSVKQGGIKFYFKSL